MKNIWNKGNVIISPVISAVFEVGGVSNTYTIKNVKKLLSQNRTLKRKIIYVIKFLMFHLMTKKRFYRIIYRKKCELNPVL